MVLPSNPAAHELDTVTRANLAAVPAPGYDFSGWGGDLSGAENPVTIVVDFNMRITASFSPEARLMAVLRGNWLPLAGIAAGILTAGVLIWLAGRRYVLRRG